MKTIDIKCVDPYYSDIEKGKKDFEIRFNDRDYRVNDKVIQRHYNPDTKEYSGKWVLCRITYVVKGFAGLTPGYCAFGFKLLKNGRD